MISHQSGTVGWLWNFRPGSEDDPSNMPATSGDDVAVSMRKQDLSSIFKFSHFRQQVYLVFNKV